MSHNFVLIQTCHYKNSYTKYTWLLKIKTNFYFECQLAIWNDNHSSTTVNRAQHLNVEDTCQPWDNINFIQPVAPATGYCCIPAKSQQFSSFFLLSSSVFLCLTETQIQANLKWHHVYEYLLRIEFYFLNHKCFIHH